MIVVSAYACEPDKGSEPGVGWHWTKEIARNHKVMVITRKNNRESIEKELQTNPDSNIEVLYYDPPKWLTFWKKGTRGVQLYYYIWQYGAYRKVADTVNMAEVEAVFGVTFGNMWKPTFMYKLDAPFIWGPVGGGEEVPVQLLKQLSIKQRIFEFVRRLSKKFPITNPWLGTICKNSALIVTRTYDSLNCIPKKYHGKCKVMIETGVDEKEFLEYEHVGVTPSQSYELTYVGRLLSLKLVDMGIRAFSENLKNMPNLKLNIVGDGEMRKTLEELIRELGIQENVCFYGTKQRKEALEILARSRCLLMTSCKEGGAWVLFEAMMCGRPIICMDTAGMKVVVDSAAGIKVPVSDYDDMVHSFAKAIEFMFKNPHIADQYGFEGRKLVMDRYLWARKGEQFETWLQEVKCKEYEDGAKQQ